ncbi:hypothetical protein DMN77_13075 [Paenibacillus sp. 79R4]|uniref:hypothetical protein n=1 Tax=Paenibacillus sp. 79R4 TaxID=2212847 RepID=UPI0015BC1252|nr:hypothetical protein [Paenibacillus sp. 79R4]NWL88502.1 hypothetical protein [Paenibacillus sp. 79R4]
MSFSNETLRKIDQFAKEQAQHYLEEAEMTYLEKLRAKTNQTKHKIGRKLARFKSSSDQAQEARNDMILYMSDYMSDLISQGLSEEEAFEKARDKLAASGDSDFQADLHERFRQYYENRDPADYEAVGLFYGGFLFLGVAIGSLIGFLTSGGVPAFMQNGWIYTLIGTGVGAIIGIGLGEISHALISMKRK